MGGDRLLRGQGVVIAAEGVGGGGEIGKGRLGRADAGARRLLFVPPFQDVLVLLRR